MIDKRPTILIMVPHYLPGFKSGGPIRTIANLVDHLDPWFSFKIITSDRDATDGRPYEKVLVNGWNKVGQAQVYYGNRRALGLRGLAHLLSRTEYDLLYLNSLFHPRFTIMPLVLRRSRVIPRKPTVVAPRGEFASSALRLEAWKKRPYLKVAAAMALYEGVIWQASSNYESEDIRQVIRNPGEICVAPNLQAKHLENVQQPRTRVMPTDRIRVVFLGRITPMKNLEGALQALSQVRADVEFNIYGPIRDETYWERCKLLIDGLPENVTCTYHGGIPNEQVGGSLREHDLLLLPTLGENFGHVIVEALRVGCPVLISDRTPWRGLENHGAGWDLPLDDLSRFASTIETVAGMTRSEREALRKCAVRFADRVAHEGEAVDANKRLFLKALGRQ